MFASNKFRLLLFIIGFTALLFWPLPEANLWWRAAFNSGHSILFIFISFIVYSYVNSRYRDLNQATKYLLVFTLGLALGFLTELAQSLLQRDASAEDLSKNVFGIIAGLALLEFFRQRLIWRRVLLLLVGFLFIMAGTYSVCEMSWRYLQRSIAFPVIVAFDQSWSTSFVRFNNTRFVKKIEPEHAGDIRRVRISFNPGVYPGISIIEPEKDWSNYKSLRFQVFSTYKQDIRLILRVHDANHNQSYTDRYNQDFIIRQGTNGLVVKLSEIEDAPDGRKIDLSNIAGIQLYLKNNKELVFLDVGNIFLQN